MNLCVFPFVSRYDFVIRGEFPSDPNSGGDFLFTTCATVCMLREIFAHHLFFSEAYGETWRAGIDILTVDAHSSLFHFRTHFLVILEFVPINYCYYGPIKWYLTICKTGTLYQKCCKRCIHPGLMRFFVLVLFK